MKIRLKMKCLVAANCLERKPMDNGEPGALIASRLA
jgi:hypothetical protein